MFKKIDENINILKLLLNSRDHPNYNNECNTALNILCSQNLYDKIIEAIKILLEDGRCYTEKRYGEALYNAVNANNVKVVKILLDPIYETNVNYCDSKGRTPFFIACERNFYDIVQLLYEHKHVDTDKPNNEGITPFEIACNDRYKLIICMLEKR